MWEIVVSIREVILQVRRLRYDQDIKSDLGESHALLPLIIIIVTR